MTRRDYTPRDILDKLLEFSQLLDDAIEAADDAAEEYAEADDDYRVSHARAFIKAKDGGATDQLAKAMADLATEGIRKRARLSEALSKNRLEAVRSRRAQLSAIQTGGNALKAELDMARYGPEVTA